MSYPCNSLAISLMLTLATAEDGGQKTEAAGRGQQVQ